MATPASARRRKSQVFVQVPPSPYSTKLGKDDRADDPGNTPLKAVAMNVDNPPSPASSSGQLKRKSPEESRAMKTKEDVQPPRSKKPKTDKSEKPDHPSKPDAASKKATSAAATEGDASPADQDLVRCHQCARKVDTSAALHCTLKRPNGQRCTFKYCRACLRNRYDLDLDVVKGKAPEAYPNADSKDKHVDGVEYLFPCPRCSDICNCRACRKSKGLPATGNLKLAGRKSVDGDVRTEVGETGQLAKKTKTKIVPTGKGKATESAVNGKVVAKEKKAAKSTSQSSPGGEKTRMISKPHVLVPPSPYKIKPTDTATTKKPRAAQTKPVAPPKPLPKPRWTILPTPLSRDAAAQRMNIREFLLRFAHIAEIAKSHLEELEELAVANAYTDSVDDDDDDADEDRLVGWISEPALRAILVGFMNLFSKDAGMRDEDTAAFTKASQQLRASGANLNKIWSALATLRQATDLSFPDPLPPPPSATQRATRTRESCQNTLVVTTAQLVDVVAALAEAALETKPVQDDFDRAADQEKDLARAARELSAAENARFRDLKSSDYKGFKLPDSPATTTKADKGDSSSGQNKAATKAVKIPLEVRRAALSEHEALLAKFDYAHRIALAECIPRFRPLGRDTDGRVYYAITPGVNEREAAVDLLEGGKGEVKFGRRRVADLDERKQLKHWSWFVGIWGRKPDGAEVAKAHGGDEEDEDKDDGDDDENVERWWAFWEPEEIAKLAEWLAMTHGINLDAKRPEKTSDDLTVLDVDGADAETKQEADKKSRGRPSNASSATSGSARTFGSLNNSDSDSDVSEPEEDEDDGNGVDQDGDVQMRLDSRGEPVPTKKDLRALARGLKDYAELLEWRVKRAAKDTKAAVDEKVDKVDKVDKGKGVERAPIPPSAFYGK